MKINNLVDRNFYTASALENISHISKLLNDHEYVAIIDEDLTTTGIITIKDLHSNADSSAIIDFDFLKPKVHPDQTIFEVFNVMKEGGTDFLPVYENDYFIGVIALMTLMERLTKAGNETKQHYQKAIHDLRNPIGNLQGLANILNESITDKENHDLIKLCNLSCKHAMDILDDLLFVEVDENKPLSKVPTEMNGFYRQCINEQLGLSLLKQIDIITELSEEKIIKDIDRNQVKRAVQNVISNAIKFSYPNSIVKISSKIDRDQIILKILDTGVGIPERYQAEVFKKFTPAQRAGTNGEPSTGLGLCFTKQCLEQHNGNIFFKSTEGKGTKFYISL
ncbi:MAG TPA: HAMP domain-containing sensor histidine kinase [Hanamia sp.]